MDNLPGDLIPLSEVLCQGIPCSTVGESSLGDIGVECDGAEMTLRPECSTR